MSIVTRTYEHKDGYTVTATADFQADMLTIEATVIAFYMKESLSNYTDFEGNMRDYINKHPSISGGLL